MKKLCVILLVGLMLLPSLASAEKTKVRWFVGLGTGSREDQLAAQEKLVETFNTMQDEIELSIEIVADTQAYDVLATQIAAGNAPDLVGPVGIRGRDSFKGSWLDLQPLVDAANYDLSDFDSAMVDFYRVKGEGLLGLPFGIYPYFMFVNLDLFDEADLPYPPQEYGVPYVDADGNEKEWNMDTVKELAMMLTVDKDGNDATSADFDKENISQFGFGIQWTDARGYATQFGAGSLVDADGNAQIPENWVAGWKWIRDAMWKDSFHPNGANGNSDYMGQGNWFQTGNLAMDMVHMWYAGCCMGEFKGNWNTAAVPSFNGTTTAKMHADSFVIMKDSKAPEAAFKVLEYILSPEGAKTLLPVYGAMPARLSMQDEYFVNFNEEKFPGQEINWQVVKDSMSYPDVPSHEAYMPSMLEATNKYGEFWTRVTNEVEVDMDAEIAALKAELQKIFDAAK